MSLMSADVMDIDEEAFRQGTVRARRYGEMTVPAEPRYIQAVKMGGREVDELVLADIAARWSAIWKMSSISWAPAVQWRP